MNETWILAGYGFNQQGPYLTIDRLTANGTQRDRFYLSGKAFTISRGNERFCIGRYDLETMQSTYCPNQASLLNTSSTICHSCFEFIGFNPSFYNMKMSDLSAKQRAYNLKEHVVYLAYFTEGLIKVGISSDSRRKFRWTEQGARLVANILSCKDAYDARDYEVAIKEQLQLAETVAGKKKRSILTYRIKEQEANKEINTVIERIESQLNVACKHEIYSLDKVYNPSNIALDSTIIDLTELDEQKISGEFIGLYGDILVMRNNDKQFMYSLKKMISHKVHLSDTVESLDFRPQQIALF